MTRDYLSPDEREERDALFIDVGFELDGTRRPSPEIGPRMHHLLEDALQAGRSWAGWMLADDAAAGHLKRWEHWDKARNRVRVMTPAGEIVPRAAVVGVRRRTKDGTSAYYQQALWRELTWSEVEQKLDEARAQLKSARINATTADRLLALRDRLPDSAGPAAACLMLGLDLEAYLAGEQNIA
ncbi:MAG: hypothetical protein ACRDYB_08390 [Acidimicrobiales bacterium]